MPGLVKRSMNEPGVRATTVILDGHRLARARAPLLEARARTVSARRGHAPRLVLIAFSEPSGRAPHVARKVRAGETVGVEVLPLIFPPGSFTGDVLESMARTIDQSRPDGVFLQFPCPVGIDLDRLAAAIPPELDVDIMTPERIAAYAADVTARPPVTVTAALQLLDTYHVDIRNHSGVIVADANPFTVMFRDALSRRGAVMRPLIPPAAADLAAEVGAAQLVAVAAASPGIVSSTQLAPGSIAIDAGYFNPGGEGDIDTSSGIEHLSAISQVPGGIGPMTVSCLLERTIEFAER